MARGLGLLALLGWSWTALAADLPSLCADRTAIERVYYAHRLGTKPPFEQAMPPALVERLVRQDLHKEAVLSQTYGVTVTPAMLAAEVQRINTTTRAPDVLAELKHALGDNPARFARSMARPILVERELHARFQNDDGLHAQQRRAAEAARNRLLALSRHGGAPSGATADTVLKETKVGQVNDATWQLTPRPADDAPAAPATPPVPTQASAHSGSYAIEATAQLAQVLASPGPAAPGSEKFYFEDLDPELQAVLRAQLQKAGDVSAVIETPGGFLIFVAREKNAAFLRVASLSIPKRSYDDWLAEQPEDHT
jgi:hypothetical protein